VTRDEEPALDTIAARVGIRTHLGGFTATTPPIVPSTTFVGESVASVHRALEPGAGGFAYSRNANPTVTALEEGIAALEGGGETIAFSSGMAALHAALLGTGIGAGDTVVASRDLYGVTRMLLSHLATFGVSVRYVNAVDVAQVDEALQEMRPDILLVESISNPLLRVASIAQLTDLAHAAGARVVVDNTFATPYLLRPLEMGVDIVVHSATKALSGHGDVTAGVVTARGPTARAIRDLRTATGGILSAFDAWLTMRGIRTLALRAARQSESALSVARWLSEQGWVGKVHYPGLPDHPEHEVASAQFGGLFGSVLTFEIRGGRDTALQFVDRLQMVLPGTSLGDAESLILYPPLSSHRGMTDDQLREAGIAPGLLRLSVGLENPRDLNADLAQASEGMKVYNLGTQPDMSSIDGE